MCGIVGALDMIGQRQFEPHRLQVMIRSLQHRGPDDESTHQEPGLAMGVRRLALVDPALGRQPMAGQSAEVWVAVNGELFDHLEVRHRLESHGHVYQTGSDTEAWLHLYQAYGPQLLGHAKGQFAVSLWDRRLKMLLLARDRMGICPLYYTQVDGWLLWASEIKALLASGLVEVRPDVKGLDHIFQFFAAGTTRTCFEGISSLPPGHSLTVRAGRVAVACYWDLDFADEGQERRSDLASLTEELEAILRRAVRRRVATSLPVTSYLSGGLDSTLLLGLAGQVRGKALPSFTIGLDQAGPDERIQASQTAALLGSPLTTVVLNRQAIAGAFVDLITAVEGPVFDTANACLLRLAQRVRAAGYPIALTGEGADELFAGYVWYRSHKLLREFGRWTAGVGPRLVRQGLGALVGGQRRAGPYRAMRGLRPAQQDLYDPLGQARAHVYSSGMWERLGQHSAWQDLDLPTTRLARWHPLHQALYLDCKLMLPGHLLLGKGDRVAMFSAVETRYPYLDEEVVAFATQLAPEYKLKGLQNKWLLRQVAKRVLPAEIANRKKAMFKADPVFIGEQPAWVRQLLSPESLRKTGYFDPQAVAREVGLQGWLPAWTPRRFVVDGSFTGVVATQLWHHLFCGGGLCELPQWTAPRAF